MKLSWLKLLPLALGFLLLGGCATDLRISGVSISIVNLRPINATVFETQAALTLRYTNESVVPIAVSSASHKVYLNGSYIGKSVNSDPVGMPSMNTVTQTVTLMVENLALLQQIQAMRGGSSVVTYRIESVLRVDAGEAYDNVKLNSTGQVDLSALFQAR